MDYLRFALVVANAALFAALLAMSLVYFRKEPSRRVRRLWLIVAVASGALLTGSVSRTLVQASILGWLPESTRESVVIHWQPLQSIVVMLLAVGAFVTLRKVAVSMAATERVAGSIIDRVSHVEPASLDLSKREREVLDLIGRGLITDAELSEALQVSASTVQSHIKHLLQKTDLHRRQDLLAVAVLVETR